MGRRTILLVVALLVAALGTGLVFAYVSRVDDRAIADQKPTEVLVVKKAVSQGTSVADAEKAGSFEIQKVAAASVAPGALSDLAPVRELFALSPLFPGEQVLQAKFGSAAATTGLAIPKGQIAMSIQLTDPARVAGFVEPGSDVIIFATGSVDPQNGTKPFDTAFTLLPRVTVLAVGPTTVARANDTTGTTNKEALPRTIITLAVTQLQAQRILLADFKGDLSFGLLTKDSGTKPIRRSVVNELVP
jgi:pilus assembly protein CpaB